MPKKINYEDKHSVSYRVEDFKPKYEGSNYIKIYRSMETEELLKCPEAYLLLNQITLRARRTNGFNSDGLELGEALIGDYKNIGLTEQKYRTAKKKLEKWGFVTIKTTNKGTIAKLIKTTVSDPNFEITNEQTNEQLTNKQRTANEQATTNKNVNNVKKEKNNIYIPGWDEFKTYALTVKHDVNIEIMQAKYNAWKLDNWKDGKGKKIVNWKSKVNHNIQYWGIEKNPKIVIPEDRFQSWIESAISDFTARCQRDPDLSKEDIISRMSYDDPYNNHPGIIQELRNRIKV